MGRSVIIISRFFREDLHVSEAPKTLHGRTVTCRAIGGFSGLPYSGLVQQANEASRTIYYDLDRVMFLRSLEPTHAHDGIDRRLAVDQLIADQATVGRSNL